MNKKYIYKITNLLNQKVYIGQAKNYKERFQTHKSQSQWQREPNKSLYRAFVKYGLENFSFEIIEHTNNYNEREKYWIQFYNSYLNGYNDTPGGEEPPVKYGENHHYAQHSQRDVDEIIKLLQNSKMTTLEIAQKYGYKDDSAIQRINLGKMWKNESLKYPLRPLSSQSGLNERADLIINDLLYSNLSQKEIAAKFNVSRTTITAINNGQNHKRDNLSYPLRVGRSTNKTIYMIDDDGNIVATFKDSIEAAIYVGDKSKANGIRSVIDQNKKLYGYYWKH